MLTSNIQFINFKKNKLNARSKKDLKNFKKENWLKKYKLLLSLTPKYQYSYSKEKLKILKKNSFFRIIGMGGSTLGAEAIYQFLQHRTKKKIYFY